MGVNTDDDDKNPTVVASMHLERVAAEQIPKNIKVFVQMVPVRVKNAQGDKVDICYFGPLF